MDYEKPTTFNPSIEDVTVKSSIWLASRLMPAKGHEKISFPHFRIVNNTGMRTADFTDLNIDALLGINDSEAVVDFESSTASLTWRGCWTINNNSIIGRGHNSFNLVCPFNTFNVGYRYKKPTAQNPNGWRPSRVN